MPLRSAPFRACQALAFLLIFAAATISSSAPASAAAPSHHFAATFGAESSTPADKYPLSAPTDVAVVQSSHDFYVTDPGNYRIEKFNEKGEFLLMFGKGVNKIKFEQAEELDNPHHVTESEENVCTGEPGEECKPGLPGATPGAFESPAYLAVDNSPTGEGDVYVADLGDSVVSKFDSTGHIVAPWGVGGQKDGSDIQNELSPFEAPLIGLAVDSHGALYVDGGHYNSEQGTIWKYTQAGQYLELLVGPGPGAILTAFGESFSILPGASVDPSDGELYELTAGGEVAHYFSPGGELIDTFGHGELFGPVGLSVDGSSHTAYVANSAANDVGVWADSRPIVTTGPPTELAETEATLTGEIEPAGRGNVTSCRFEYGFDKSYGATVLCTPDPEEHEFTATTKVTATLKGFSPGTEDHYRLVAANAAGAKGFGADQTFVTTQAPAIDGLASANLTATSADLNAQIDPDGLETHYRFEYGPTTSYGQSAPLPDGVLTASSSDQPVGIHLEHLTPHVVYHYRLLATNSDGTTASEDQTFNFYPPTCPNENVRQQTQANYLPDCRAYELVSPENAGGTQLYTGGPNTGFATSPSRFSFVGLFSAIPGAGGDPIDSYGDLYVATRTDTGWVTRYVGLPATQTPVDGGPPQGPPGSSGYAGNGSAVAPVPTFGLSNGANPPDRIQNNVLTDPEMNTFLDWKDGREGAESGQFPNPTPMASNAPYVWSADGAALGRWPTNLATVPAGLHSHVIESNQENLTVEPGGLHALDCPATVDNFFSNGPIRQNTCPGDVTASVDLTHFVFASEWNAFTPEGQIGAPGSVYDNNTATGSIAVASRLPGGAPIPAEPADHAADPLQIPAVSADGSHILIASGATGPCGSSTCYTPPCGGGDFIARCPMQPSQLYMRIDGATTVEIAPGHPVTYAGMTEDGSRVFFLSEEPLTAEDFQHTGPSLYMWSQAGEEAHRPLTLISKADNPGLPGEPGNTGACSVSWTTGCGIVTYSALSSCQQESGLGGNCHSDSSISSATGDVYFFSPEQLDGTRGVPGQENLYDYREGRVQYVTTLSTGNPPIARMEVTPDDAHMAFITASPITSYDNAGHLEMYTYNPATSKIVCVSCIPSGAPPTSDVQASQDGLFMTNDGRAFFSTEDALVHADTDKSEDVYEYVNGRPQLITPGTGDTTQAKPGEFSTQPGLIGVSVNGTDVYFSTFDTLAPQDHNGLFLKFYDARTGGGFPVPAPSAPCEAADECHGPGSSPPSPLPEGTVAPVGQGGNLPADPHRHHHRKRRHRRGSPRRHAHRAATGQSKVGAR